MRQVGVLAAAALVALRDGPARLHVDHDNAKAFAGALAGSGLFDVDVTQVRTNIVIFAPRAKRLRADADELLRTWKGAGVLVNHIGGGRFRAVTHCDVGREDVLAAAELLGR